MIERKHYVHILKTLKLNDRFLMQLLTIFLRFSQSAIG